MRVARFSVEGGVMMRFFLFAAVFLSVSFAAGAILSTSDLVSYYSMDTGAYNSTHAYDVIGVYEALLSPLITASASGKINQTLDFERSNTDALYIQFNETQIAGRKNVTVSAWIKRESTGVLSAVYANRDAGGYNFLFRINNADNALQLLYNDAGLCADGSIALSNTSAWYHVVAIFQGGINCQLYVNGVTDINTSTATTTLGTGAFNQSIGADVGDSGSFFDGFIDDVAIFNRALTNSEVQDLYNVGLGLYYLNFTNGTSSSYFLVTASDAQTSEGISNFSLKAGSFNYSTTNGTINTNLTGGTYNLTVSSSNYINVSYLNYNVSVNKAASLYQTVIYVLGRELYTGSVLNGSILFNNSVQTFPLLWKAGSYNFTFFNSSYFNKSQQFDVSALFNGTVNVSNVSNAFLNVTVKNAYTFAILANFSGWAYAKNYGVNHSLNGSAGYDNVSSLNASNYTVYVEVEGYAISDADNYLNTTVNSSLHNITLYLYSSNSILISIYDELTGMLITGINITITVTGNSTENIYVATNGTYFLSNLSDGNYSLKFQGGNYTLKTYTVTVADRSTQQLNAYLSSSYSTVTFNIVDSGTQAPIEGASFIMARIINSSWTTTESKSSDITGRVQASYLTGVQYRFTITAAGYSDKVFYLDPVIFSSYTVFMDSSAQPPAESDYYDLSIVHYPVLFYNGVQNNLTFIIGSPNGILQSYGVNLTFPQGSLQGNGSLSTGQQFDFSFNITDAGFLDYVNLTFWYDTTLGEYKSFSYHYGIIGANPSNNQTWIRMRDSDKGGMGDLEKVLIGLFFTMILTGAGYMLGGGVSATVFGVISWGIFSYLQFVPLWGILPTLLVGVMLMFGGNK